MSFKFVIAHRGLTEEISSADENLYSTLKKTVAEFPIELDVFVKDGYTYLAHDEEHATVRSHIFSLEVLLNELTWAGRWIFVHLKNQAAVEMYGNASFKHNANIHLLLHQTDPIVYTSKGKLWSYTNNFVPGSIVVTDKLPEEVDFEILKRIPAVCTKKPITWKKFFDENFNQEILRK